MSIVASGKNRYRTNAAVKVLDSAGRPVVGATVSGSWSGLVRGNVSGTTGGDGVVNFASATTRSSGTFTLTGASLANYQYDASLNTETSDSISR
jgi:hypothetical protein